MFLNASELDSSVTFERKVITKDPKLGTAKKGGWEPYAEDVPAKAREVLASRGERLEGSVNMSLQPVRIVIRWRPDITGAMRVIYNDRTLEIVSGPTMMGRRVGLEMIAQEFSSSGDAGR